MSDWQKEQVVVDNVRASWVDLESALLKRWPSGVENFVTHVVEHSGGQDFLCIYVKLNDERKEISKASHQQSKSEDGGSEATDSKLLRAKKIFRMLGGILNSFADACDE